MKKSFIILILSLCTIVGVEAQNSSLRTGYFNERMYMNHELNPALVGDYGYVTVPMLGQIGFSVNTNLGVGDFLFPGGENGELKSFLHPDISTEEFLSGLNNMNSLSQSFNLNIMSFGFFGFGGYNTFSTSIHQNANVYIPDDLFMVLKGGGQSTYDLSGMGFDFNSYAEVSLGHSRKLLKSLTVGIKLKGLIGLAYADIKTDNTYMTMTDDVWSLSANATGSIAAMGGVIDLDEDDNLTMNDDFSPKAGGLGAAIDLGAVYTMLDDKLKLSLAITDLGFIKWKSVSTVSIDGGEVVLLDYADEYDYDTAGDDISDRLESLSDDVQDIFSVGDVVTSQSSNRWLTSTLTAGAEYEMFDNLLSFGLLSTTTFGYKTETELMGVVGVTPLPGINFSFSGSLSTTGNYVGCLVNICPKSFLNFYIGADCLVSKVSPQMLPVKSGNLSVSFGLAIPIGGDRSIMNSRFL